MRPLGLPADAIQAARWCVAPGVDLPLPPTWMADCPRRVVKTAPHRSVLELTYRGERYFLKHDHAGCLLDAFRRSFRRSSARREWERTQQVAARGIPTIEPVAYGERRRWGFLCDGFFLSRAVENSEPLEDLLLRAHNLGREDSTSHMLAGLPAALGRFCAQCHEAGIDHRDFHPGNILVRHSESAGTWDLLLIDLPNVRIGASLDWPKSLCNLASLFSGTRHVSRPADWRRFWFAYVRRRPTAVLPRADDAFSQVSAEARRHASRILRSRDKRILRSTQDFLRFDHGQGRVHAVRDLDRTVLESIVDGGTTASNETMELTQWPRATDLALKQALSSWQTGHALLARRVPTPRPLVVILPWKGERPPILVRERLVGPTLQAVLEGQAETNLDLETAAKSAGRLLGRLHRWGFAHGSLKTSEIQLVLTPRGWKAVFLEVGHIAFGASSPESALDADLVTLWQQVASLPRLSPRAVRGFLEAYLEVSDRPRRSWTALAGQILSLMPEKNRSVRAL